MEEGESPCVEAASPLGTPVREGDDSLGVGEPRQRLCLNLGKPTAATAPLKSKPAQVLAHLNPRGLRARRHAAVAQGAAPGRSKRLGTCATFP